MKLDAVKQAVFGYFNTQWADRTALTLEDEDFDPETEGGDEWIRLAIRELDSNQHTLGKPGNRHFERLAAVFIQVYTREGRDGTQRRDTLADAARDILEGTNAIAGVRMFEGQIITQDPDGYWERVVVQVNMSYDDLK